MSKVISGIAASDGIAIAKAVVWENWDFDIERKNTMNPDTEIQRLQKALHRSEQDLESIKRQAVFEVGQEQAEIFSAHLLFLHDSEYIDRIKEKIQNEYLNAESAVREITDAFIDIFKNMENEYMKERAMDVRDVSRRILGHLLHKRIFSTKLEEEVIIVSRDLTPSDTAQLNQAYVAGFTTDIGGLTSHSAIMARAMEIPAVVGVKQLTEEVETDATLIIDGTEGKVIVHPSNEQLQFYRERQRNFETEKRQQKAFVHESTITNDGHSVMLAGNIGSPDD